MPGLRAPAQEHILKYVDRIDPSGHNRTLYEAKFAAMDDVAFERFIDNLEAGHERLALVAPNFSEVKLDVERNFGIADELGHNFFQRVWMPSVNGVPKYLTPIPYLVVDLPVRRQAQLLEKKISIPQDNNTVDDFTGQVTGASKGSKISYPEVQVLMAMGLEESATEMLKVRGGDEGAFNAMNTMISRSGGVSQKAIQPYATGVQSKAALHTLLTCMMLSDTL